MSNTRGVGTLQERTSRTRLRARVLMAGPGPPMRATLVALDRPGRGVGAPLGPFIVVPLGGYPDTTRSHAGLRRVTISPQDRTAAAVQIPIRRAIGDRSI